MFNSDLGKRQYMDADFNDVVKTRCDNNSYNINNNVVDYNRKKLKI